MSISLSADSALAQNASANRDQVAQPGSLRISIPIDSQPYASYADSRITHQQASYQRSRKTQAQGEAQGWISAFQIVSVQLLLLVLLVSLSAYTRADNRAYLANAEPDWQQLALLVDEEKRPALSLDPKAARSSWALAIDNDILAPGHRDRDYTYGLNFTYSGAGARDADLSLREPLSAIDRLLGIENEPSTRDGYSLEFGFFGFTPATLTDAAPDYNDRPYASLVYFSSSHEQIDLAENLAWKTTLTLGALGTGLVGELQNITHEQLGGKPARGWNNQISEGGELTGRYVIARQHLLEGLSETMEVKSTLQASVGYLTEASWSLSMRSGKLFSPWSSFNPELISYGEKSTYTSTATPTTEHYFWAGITLKLRAYNAFLQGQFRNSEVTYGRDELHPLVLEGWAGYTYAFKQGYRFSYVLRGQTSEIKQGDGDRNVLWGGLILSKVI